MAGFVMNTRRAPFHDRRVREALAHAFDFEWTNRVLFHGAYARTRSYFNNADLSARGRPDPREIQLLAPWRGRVPEEVFTRAYMPPRTGGTGEWRANRREATRLLREAGYRIEDGALVARDGTPVGFEILLDSPQLERVALPYAEHLRQLGIAASVRTVDAAQYEQRLNGYDFDMTAAQLGQSESPGREQRGYWSSAEADTPGGRNLAGVRDPAVDAVIAQLIAAPDRETLAAATRALDRLLQWGHYVVPFWHAKADRVAYWDRFGRPARAPRSGVDPTYWWVDPARDAGVQARRSQAPRQGR
jgi:microcin C transport system substrate-binding protein